MSARSRLLQAATSVCRLGGLRDGLPRSLSSLPSVLPAPGLQRPFSSKPDAPAQQAQDPAAEQADAAAGYSGAQPPARLARHVQHHSLFMPRSWEQQGAADAGNPLVQELRSLLSANKAEAARHAFEAALAPLESQLAQGQTPDPDDVPPPYAWKMYFVALAGCSAHPFQLNSRLHLMQRLGVPPQTACFVTTLRCMAKQGLGSPAYTTLHEMKTLGLSPTLRCYLFTISAALRQRPPELGYAHKLLVEVSERGLVKFMAHKVQMGKFLVQAAREFARHRRFSHAFEALDQLEGLGLRVPVFVVADITHQATMADAPEQLLECVRRLEHTTQMYQPSARAQPVTRPLKVEEGLLLNVLQVAASKGHVPLAEATWQLLERSLALPNAPGPVLLRYSKSAEQPGAAAAAAADAAAGAAEEDGLDAEAEIGSDEDEDAAAARQQAAADSRQLEAVSERLEASDAAAAEKADAAHNFELLKRTARRGEHAAHAWSAEAAAAEVAAMASEQRGVRKPTLVSYLALIHAYANARRDVAMLEAVDKLLRDLPEHQGQVQYHSELPMAVDSLARSIEACDEAFFKLESWAKQGRPVRAELLNLVVAAYCQIGDLKRAFATVDAFGRLGVATDADTYNALMEGCLASGRVGTARDVHNTMLQTGQEGNQRTHELLVEANIVSGDVDGMLAALTDLEAAGYTPKAGLLERCVARAERAGHRDALRHLLKQLFAQDYRIVGVDAKARRWEVEGGMVALTGSSSFLSREDVGFEIRKSKAIVSRLARRRLQQQHQQGDG